MKNWWYRECFITNYVNEGDSHKLSSVDDSQYTVLLTFKCLALKLMKNLFNLKNYSTWDIFWLKGIPDMLLFHSLVWGELINGTGGLVPDKADLLLLHCMWMCTEQNLWRMHHKNDALINQVLAEYYGRNIDCIQYCIMIITGQVYLLYYHHLYNVFVYVSCVLMLEWDID